MLRDCFSSLVSARIRRLISIRIVIASRVIITQGLPRPGCARWCRAWTCSETQSTWISTIDGDDDDDETRRLARSLRACSISLRCFRYNKGLGFTEGERDRLYLRGLLPPAVLSQDVQAERVLTNLNNMISCVACCVLLAACYLLTDIAACW
jgi:hypothetical protein